MEEEREDDSIQLEGSDEENKNVSSDGIQEETEDEIHLIDEVEEIVESLETEPTELERRLKGVTDPFERKIIELEYRKEQRSSRRR